MYNNFLQQAINSNNNQELTKKIDDLIIENEKLSKQIETKDNMIKELRNNTKNIESEFIHLKETFNHEKSKSDEDISPKIWSSIQHLISSLISLSKEYSSHILKENQNTHLNTTNMQLMQYSPKHPELNNK